MSDILSVPKLYTTEEAAELLGLSIGHLQNDRSKGATIPYVKIGRAVRYTAQDITAYNEANRQPALNGRAA